MIAAALGRIVGFVQRRAVSVIIAILLLSVVSGFYAATNLKVDTDIGHMLPSHLGGGRTSSRSTRPFRRTSI